MAPRSDQFRLREAWRALGSLPGTTGWHSTHLATIGMTGVRAALRMPDGNEAVLIGFRDIRLPPAAQLPSGKGFLVEAVTDPGVPGMALLALTRQTGANLDLFEGMALDIVQVLVDEADSGASIAANSALARVRAWQDFMLRERSGILSEEDEVGLHGELCVLGELVDGFQDGAVAVEAWQGPLRGLHDFSFSGGAIEVKSSTSPSGFRAAIASLDQLDVAIRWPLHVAAVRLADTPGGVTLPERVAEIRDRIASNCPSALQAFSMRLMRAGYTDVMAAHYTRRLLTTNIRAFPVSGRFPVLSTSSVPAGVMSANYVIDLDALELPSMELTSLLQTVGI